MSSQGVAEENPHRKHQRNAKADTWKKTRQLLKMEKTPLNLTCIPRREGEFNQEWENNFVL